MVPLDYFAKRYGDSKGIRFWAWISNVPSLLGIFIAQLLACGGILAGLWHSLRGRCCNHGRGYSDLLHHRRHVGRCFNRCDSDRNYYCGYSHTGCCHIDSVYACGRKHCRYLYDTVYSSGNENEIHLSCTAFLPFHFRIL